MGNGFTFYIGNSLVIVSSSEKRKGIIHMLTIKILIGCEWGWLYEYNSLHFNLFIYFPFQSLWKRMFLSFFSCSSILTFNMTCSRPQGSNVFSTSLNFVPSQSRQINWNKGSASLCCNSACFIPILNTQ